MSINVSVIDRGTNRGVVGLKQQDFRLFEDGVEQQIAQFESSSAPFNLVLLIDLSGSTSRVMDLIRTAALHFERIKATVAADVENRLTRQVERYRVFEELPEIGREIAQRVIRGRENVRVAAQAQIVEPRAQLVNASLQSRLHL